MVRELRAFLSDQSRTNILLAHGSAPESLRDDNGLDWGSIWPKQSQAFYHNP